ncbi:SoxR reducing system RseC family protein [Lamprobacter modestohalophilus]|uniref:SoxR reducing system RseC family protein n=1 Tax=Lamprobacter modestohalophilus TaxID=1064514 RepID=UPI002ADED6B5|nr:SoxR reducing system RseC family protein [Lamprobacter modestohalophilus]MEA1051696.1 SoxR reducing system RseC family protein [Lamprobacter modestohalophilus]
MIEEQGIVVAIEAGIAEVEIVRRSTCGACSARSGCGVSLLDRVLGRRPQRLLLADKLKVRPGDEVIVGIPEGALLKAAVVAYMVPLFGLLAGAILGDLPRLDGALDQGLPLLTGALGFGAGLLVTHLYSRRLAVDPRWRAVLLRRATHSLSVGLPSTR